MAELQPKHGAIDVVPRGRRKWCATCGVWTWEVTYLGSNIWRHARRTPRCKARGRR